MKCDEQEHSIKKKEGNLTTTGTRQYKRNMPHICEAMITDTLFNMTLA